MASAKKNTYRMTIRPQTEAEQSSCEAAVRALLTEWIRQRLRPPAPPPVQGETSSELRKLP